MASISNIYTNKIKNQLNYYATWLPNKKIELGDYGRLDNNEFERIGNIYTDLGISISVIQGVPACFEYNAEASREITNNLGLSLELSNPVGFKSKVNLTFKKKDSVFFSSPKCVPSEIMNINDISKQLLNLFYSDKWDESFVVVTTLVGASATTAIISNNDNSSISFLTTASLTDATEVFDGSIELSIKSENNIAFKSITEKDITPLFRLSKIDFGIFESDRFIQIPASKFKAVRRRFILTSLHKLKRLMPKRKVNYMLASPTKIYHKHANALCTPSRVQRHRTTGRVQQLKSLPFNLHTNNRRGLNIINPNKRNINLNGINYRISLSSTRNFKYKNLIEAMALSPVSSKRINQKSFCVALFKEV